MTPEQQMYKGEVEEVDSQASSDDEESEQEASIPATQKTITQPNENIPIIVEDLNNNTGDNELENQDIPVTVEGLNKNTEDDELQNQEILPEQDEINEEEIIESAQDMRDNQSNIAQFT